MQANPGTLLTRFYGVHRVTPIIGRQVRFLHARSLQRSSTWHAARLPLPLRADLPRHPTHPSRCGSS